MKLLVVEDEALLRHHLYTRLGEQGHVVDAVPDAEEALYRVSEYHHDLAVIDLGLPGMSGLDLIRELRSQGKSFPILILTARGNWQDKVEGLAAGADDYVVKPFQFEELEARLNALLRRSSGFVQSTIEAGPLVLDLNRKQALVEEQPVALTAYEYRILEYLMRHHQQVVAKERLMEQALSRRRGARRQRHRGAGRPPAAQAGGLRRLQADRYGARPGLPVHRALPVIRSLRIRLMLGAAALAVLFMLALLPALQRAFGIALENTIEQRLAADVATLVSAARVEKGRLVMPEHLPVEEFNLPEAKVLGYIYDQNGDLLWRSTSAADESINYTPRYDGRGNEFHTTRDAKGEEFFVFDVEIDLLRGKQAAYSIVTMQSVSEFESLLKGFREQLYLWLGGALLVLLGLLWLGLTWGFRAMRGLSSEAGPDRIRRAREPERGASARAAAPDPLAEPPVAQRAQAARALPPLPRRPGAQSEDAAGGLAGGRRPARRGARQPRAGAGATGPDRAHEPADRLSVAARQPAQERPGTPSRATGAAGGDPVRRAGQGLSRQAGKPAAGLLAVLQRAGGARRAAGTARQPAGERLSPVPGPGPRGRPAGAGLLRLWVEDDGPGVPAEQRARIIRRGERADTQHPGQGIGLAVALDIIESYDGELSLDDSELGGACFRIRFATV